MTGGHRNRPPWGAITGGGAVATGGIVLILLGVHLADTNSPAPHNVGAALTDLGLAILTGLAIGAILIGIERRYQQREDARAEASAKATAIDLALLTTQNLAGIDLHDHDLRGRYLRGRDFCDANLANADLRGADLIRANLTKADLTGADLRGACLYAASFESTDITGADLRSSAGFDPAAHPSVIRDETTRLPGVILPK